MVGDDGLILPDASLDDRPRPIVPFSRHVMNTLASGVAAVREMTSVAPGKSADVSPSSALESGASPALCAAVAKMANQTGVSGLGLDFNWAAAGPAPNPEIQRSTRFGRPEIDRLAVVRERLLREPVGPTFVEVEGPVEVLRRGFDANSGEVTVKAELDGRERAFRAELFDENYRIALQAHDARAFVVLRGTLDRSSSHWRIAEPRLQIERSIPSFGEADPAETRAAMTLYDE